MTPFDIWTSLEMLIHDADHENCAAFIGKLEKMRALAWGKIMAIPSAHPNSQSDYLLTLAEAAIRLSIPESRAYELARQKKLPSVRIGKYVRVSTQALAEYQARLPKA
jgi:excisionase family DNA binding protein